MSGRSDIDDAAKLLLRKADRSIARNLGRLAFYAALVGAGFALGAWLL